MFVPDILFEIVEHVDEAGCYIKLFKEANQSWEQIQYSAIKITNQMYVFAQRERQRRGSQP